MDKRKIAAALTGPKASGEPNASVLRKQAVCVERTNRRGESAVV
jgi:hypothetical protein